MSRSKKTKTETATAVATAVTTPETVTSVVEQVVEGETQLKILKDEAAKLAMKEKIDDLLKVRQQMAELKAKDDLLKAEIHDFMKEKGVETIRTEGGTEVKMVKGSRRDVTPRALFAALGNNVEKLLDSVKVVMGEAERFLTKTQMNDISTKNEYSYVKCGSYKGSDKIVYL